MTYTERFGTGTIQSTQVSYLALSPTGNITLDWPKETAPSPNLLATIIDVDSGSTPVSITLPDAMQGSNGAEFLINNVGNATVTVLDNTGGAVLTLVVGQAWVIYLRDNTTAAGLWRTFQLGSLTSQAQAASLAGTGLIAIGNTLAGDLPSTSFSASGTNFVLTDRARAYRWTGGAGSCNLPSSGTVPVGWYMRLRNDGTGALTVNPTGGDTINGSASLVMQQGDSCLILCAAVGIMDTYGLGKSTTSTFDYTTIAVGGTGAYTLSGAELNRISYKFTGVLTGDRTIIVPATVQQYWVTNATTGAFNFYVKTLAQVAPGVLVTQGQASILYSDSNNVVNADTASGGLSVPVTIAQGGTNATTAGAARTNLGSTATGDSLFTAASAAAARAAIDAAALGSVNTFTAIAQSITNAAVGDFMIWQSSLNAATVGPDVVLDRTRTAAANDLLGRLIFRGRSTTGVSRNYADDYAKVITATNAAEDAERHFQTIAAGALADKFIIGKGGVYTPGAAGGDKGLDTINATQLAEANVFLVSKYIAISLLTTNGDIIIRSGGVPARLAVGGATQVLGVSGGLPAWVAKGLTVTAYDSGVQAITAGGTITLTHGLGGEPQSVMLVLACTSAELGYSIGDHVITPSGTDSGRGVAAQITATQIIVQISSTAQPISIIRKDTNAAGNITAASWNMIVRAQRFS